MEFPVTFAGVEITEADMLKARQHHIDINKGCIREAKSGEVRVNDLDRYIIWCEDSIKRIEEGRSDHTFTLLQTAHYLKTGKSIALLP